MLTIRLSDDNYLKWSYQLESVLQGYDLFGYLDGSVLAPPKFAILDEEGVTSEVTAAYKDWLRTDKALLSLLIASLSDEALEYVIGSRTAREAWLNLTDRYASVSRARINHLKTEMQTAQKGGDSIERFLLRLKHIRDQLHSAGVKISDDDFVIATLNGLPQEYDIIKNVLIARDTSISLKDFRAQLLVAEQTAEARVVNIMQCLLPNLLRIHTLVLGLQAMVLRLVKACFLHRCRARVAMLALTHGFLVLALILTAILVVVFLVLVNLVLLNSVLPLLDFAMVSLPINLQFQSVKFAVSVGTLLLIVTITILLLILLLLL